MTCFLGAVVLGAALFAGAATTHANDRLPAHGIWLDATEVTIGQFRSYAKATGTVTEAERSGGGYEWGAGWERRAGWTVYMPHGVPPSTDREPAVHLSWHEASSYCAWRGGRLPTAAEWIAAAYTEDRDNPPAGFETGETYAYPLGDDWRGANTNASADPWENHAPAASTPAGVNGLYDMGANVWEWVADARGDTRRTMGGSWWYGPERMRADVVAYKPAAFHAVYVGFRCAYDTAS